MTKPCEGPEWEDLLDALLNLEFSNESPMSDEEYNAKLNHMIAEAGFDLAEALAKLRLDDEEAWADFVSRAVVIHL